MWLGAWGCAKQNKSETLKVAEGAVLDFKRFLNGDFAVYFC